MMPSGRPRNSLAPAARPTGLLTDRVAVGRLLTVVPPDLADEVIAETQAWERRARRLPARLTLYVSLALWLWPRDGYVTVYRRLADGLAWSGYDGADTAPIASSVARALDRLGPEPLQALFRRLTSPAVGCPLRVDITRMDVSVVSGLLGARVITLTDPASGGIVDATWAPAMVDLVGLMRRLTYPRDHPSVAVDTDSPTHGHLIQRITGRADMRLRSQGASGVDQEIWALLCVYQALAIPAATTPP